jgi:type IV pilus assembly protein PilB
MQMSTEIRNMVLRRSPGTELRKQAIAEGMTTMRQSGFIKVVEGITSTAEVVRVLASED